MAHNIEQGFIVSFEGGDGSGKGTQTKLFGEWLTEIGVPNHFDSFPRYHTPTGERISRYLHGNPDNLGPEEAGLLYADDRLSAREELIWHIEQGHVVELDRYLDSNKGHQGGRIAAAFREMYFASEEERRAATIEAQLAYFRSVDELELGTNQIPAPTATILFPVRNPRLAQEYVARKRARSYTNLALDSHEADPFHLKDANEAYELLAASQPGRIVPIEPAVPDGESYRPIGDIHSDVQRAIRPLLEARGFRIPAA